MDEDPTNPQHYRSHPSGVECITVTEHMNFCRGNAVKYIWRSGEVGGAGVEDLRKAIWYLEREIQRLSGSPSAPVAAFAAALSRKSADAPIPYRPATPKRRRK